MYLETTKYEHLDNFLNNNKKIDSFYMLKVNKGNMIANFHITGFQ
jgi:hypothetical protein